MENVKKQRGRLLKNPFHEVIRLNAEEAVNFALNQKVKFELQDSLQVRVPKRFLMMKKLS